MGDNAHARLFALSPLNLQLPLITIPFELSYIIHLATPILTTKIKQFRVVYTCTQQQTVLLPAVVLTSLLGAFCSVLLAPGQLPSSAVSSYVYLSDFMDTTLPEQLQLTLPLGSSDTPQPVMVVHRADVHSTGVWVGELQVAPGPLSVVTLVLTEDTGTVLYGDAIYWDPEVAKMRTVMVSGAVDEVHAATYSLLTCCFIVSSLCGWLSACVTARCMYVPRHK